jgi:DNA-directed RNA polymerase subunit alpha
MRRVLLSSIEGAAITAVRIDGVLHEFTSIPGVVEDTTDLILNLKQVPLKLSVDHPETITLRAEGAGEVKAGDIETNPNVEILNPDLHIATLQEEGKLHVEMRVRQGRGYVPADRNFEPDLPLGYIPIDSVHSPVRKVSYSVEDARLGQMTDYDRLVLEVWTNGAVAPSDAVALASKLIKDHLAIFINFEESQEVEEKEGDKEREKLNENLNRSIEELELSVRSYNCLKNAEIRTIRDLVQKSEAEMLKTKNFGRKSLNEIKEILAEMGLSLGMKLEEPVPATME